jgi:hypothetical protein
MLGWLKEIVGGAGERKTEEAMRGLQRDVRKYGPRKLDG